MKAFDKTTSAATIERGPSRRDRLRDANTDKASTGLASDAGSSAGVNAKRKRWAIGFGQYSLAAVITVLLVAKLSFLLRSDPRIPLTYSGDSLLTQILCKSMVDHGWYLSNPNLGAPYGQSMQDFPLCETLNFLLFKAFALLTGNAQLALNMLTLGSYVGVTLSALAVLRQFRIAYPPALACSLLYSLLPYHFYRVDCGHQWLACYYIVPLSILLAMWLYADQLPWPRRGNRTADRVDVADDPPVRGSSSNGLRWCVAVLICLLQGSAGIYYAFFAEYFLVVGGLAASFQRRKWQPLGAASILVAVTLATVLANSSPSFFYWWKHGTNPAVGARPVTDSEVYALKLTSTLLPIPEHRIGPLAELRACYDEETVTPTENTWSSQGAVANCGLLVLLSLLIYRKPVSRLLEGLSILNIFGILFATTGGLGVIFSLIVFPQIRSQNRISVFLSFYCLACIALLLHWGWQRLATTRRGFHLANGLLIALVVVALWEQHPQQCRSDYVGIKPRWNKDAQFVAQIESVVPAKAMIFQLPYMTFPESPRVQGLDSYQTLRFYLHSDSLRWSSGNMKGREGDRWQQQIAALPLQEQVKAIAAAGFSGIQVSRLGYADHAEDIEVSLRELLGVEPMTSENHTDSFFALPAAVLPGATMVPTASAQNQPPDKLPGGW